MIYLDIAEKPEEVRVKGVDCFVLASQDVPLNAAHVYRLLYNAVVVWIPEKRKTVINSITTKDLYNSPQYFTDVLSV